MNSKLICPFCGSDDIGIKSDRELEECMGFTDIVETFYRYCNKCHEGYVDSDLSDINSEQFTKFHEEAKNQYALNSVSRKLSTILTFEYSPLNQNKIADIFKLLDLNQSKNELENLISEDSLTTSINKNSLFSYSEYDKNIPITSHIH